MDNTIEKFKVPVYKANEVIKLGDTIVLSKTRHIADIVLKSAKTPTPADEKLTNDEIVVFNTKEPIYGILDAGATNIMLVKVGEEDIDKINEGILYAKANLHEFGITNEEIYNELKKL